MSKLLTDSSTWETQVECPVSGDARTAASVEAGFQDLANRTKYLKDLAGSGGGGVAKIQTVLNSTALIALTGMAADDVCMLKSTGRIFQFISGSTAPSHLVFRGYAYDAGDASGYWRCFAPIGAEVIEQKHVSVENIDTTVGAYQAITGDTDWHNVTDGVDPMTIALDEALLEDDVIEVDCHFGAAGDGSSTGVFRVVVNFSGSDHVVEGSGCYSGGGTDVYTMNCSGRYTVPAGGATSVTVTLQGKVSNGAQTLTVGDTSVFLGVKVYRRTP